MAELSDDDSFHEADIYLDPPSNDVTDEDSGKEDSVDINNLTGGQLRAKAIVTLRKKHQEKQIIGQSDSDEDVHDICSNKRNRRKRAKIPRNNRNWSKRELSENNTLQLTWNGVKPVFLNIRWSPTSLFELFINDEIIEYILERTILYAGQKGNPDFIISTEELKLFFAILLTSGYNVLPRR